MRKPCLITLVATACLCGPTVRLHAQPAGTQPASPLAQKPAVQTAQAPKLPPSDSPPLLRFVQLDFPTQGGASVIEPDTYLYYIKCAEQVSRPSDGVWTAYSEQTVLEDFQRLWNTKFLDNLWIEVKDVPYENGVAGKHVIFNLEERQRVKIVDYVGSKKLEQSKIDEKLKEVNAQVRLDSFIDPSLVQKVKGVVLAMLAEKGLQYATVTPEIKELEGGPKLVHLTFKIVEGPKVKIGRIDFVGNTRIGNAALSRQMKENKARSLITMVTGKGSYQEAKFEEDADKVIEYYRDRGYISARVGEPELKVLSDSRDRKTRWVQLRIPVMEGDRFRVGTVTFDGNKVVKIEALQDLFSKLKPGSFYSDKVVRKGLEKAREVYGSGGYFEFTAYPDLKPREPVPAASDGTAADQLATRETSTGGRDGAAAADGETSGAKAAAAGPVPVAGRRPAVPTVDVTMRIQEGKQYFVNRITFVGNTTTRDNVVRREVRLFEEGVFNTEALKYSIKRINQLAYLKPLEGGKDVNVEKTPGADNKVDVTLKFEEQNRNQLTFGAGVSQYEGFFGQLAFQTANFMGRGETFSVSVQAGSRAQNYQIAFTEPFLFDRAITGGVDIFKREIKYLYQFTEASVGGNVVFGFPVRDFTRMFINYSYERARVKDINEAYLDPQLIGYNPFLADALLLTQGGSRTISKITPSIVKNTVDNPIFPATGQRLTAQIDLAGLGGNTNFYKPMLEGAVFLQHTKRSSLGLRAQVEYLSPFTRNSLGLPIFEQIVLGGEYSVRGYDIRSIGPKAAPVVTFPSFNGKSFLPGLMEGEVPLAPTTTQSGVVIGGNKSLLFNAEYLITIAGPVRLVLFFDAGQALGKGQSFALNQFKTSLGPEIRFFMPVLNVPFRLIFAYNPNREGVLDSNYSPAKKFTFKFAVGTTF